MQTEEEKISRIAEKVALRIVKIYGNGGGGTSSAIESWVSENFLSIEFFSNLFKAYGPAETEGDPDIEILPNDTQSTISNIKAMFGFWTEQYVSALGQNPDGGGGSVVLNACLSSINASALGVPTGVNTGLIFNGNTWVYREMNDINMSAVWQALGASTSEQINISHLTDALVNYATASDVGTLQGYFTNGKANSALEADTLATARTIWGQSFDGSANITGNMTGVTNIDALLYFDTTNSRIGVIQQTPAYTLDVTGTMRLTGAATFGSTITATGLITANGGITIPSGQSLTIGDAVITWDATAQGIKITKGLYSETFISALGAGSTGSGGVDMTTVWNALAASTSEQINASHLTGALSTYATQSYVATYVTNNLALYNLSDVDVSGVTSGQYLKFNGQKWVPSTISGTGSVNSITIGSGGTNYTPDASGIVTLPAYPTVPTNISAFTNDSGYITSSALNGYATTTQLANYLPLSGGKLTGRLLIKGDIPSHFPENYLASLYINNDLQIGWTALVHSSMVEILMCSTSANGIIIRSTSNSESLFECIGKQTSLSNGGTTIFKVNANGNVGINTASPSSSLHITGSSLTEYSDTYAITANHTGSNNACGILLQVGGNTKGIALYNSSSWGMSIINFVCVKALGIKDDGTPFYGNLQTYYKIWHEGDDGAGSGLDADLLDGHHGSYYASASDLSNYLPLSGGKLTGRLEIKGSTPSGLSPYVSSLFCNNNLSSAWTVLIQKSNVFQLFLGSTSGDAISFSSIATSTEPILIFKTQQSTLGSGGTTVLSLLANGKLGINTSSPSYEIHVVGDIYATGGVTCLSDARKKDVIGELPMTVEDVAGAPAVRFLWKDNRVAGNQAGTLAQYWQRVLPEVITDKSGELSMQYGVAALVSAIVTARKVVDHERRIRELESENAQLRKDLDGMNKRLSRHISDSMPLR